MNIATRYFKLLGIVVAFVILGVSLYVTNAQDKQRNSGKDDKVRTEQVVEQTPTPTETPKSSPTGTARASERSATSSGLLRPPSERTERKYQFTVADVQAEIRRVFEKGYEADWALFIAECESTFNPFAVNPSGFYGLFQYHPGTYKACGGSDIWDWREQILITKKCMYDGGRQDEFPACSLKWNMGR